MDKQEIQKDLKRAEKMMAYAEKIKEPLMYKAWAKDKRRLLEELKKHG